MDLDDTPWFIPKRSQIPVFKLEVKLKNMGRNDDKYILAESGYFSHIYHIKYYRLSGTICRPCLESLEFYKKSVETSFFSTSSPNPL